MKIRIRRMVCDRLTICGLITLLVMTGCQSDTAVIRELNRRHYTVFSGSVMTDIKWGQPLLNVQKTVIDGTVVPATHVRVTPDFAACSVAIAQPIDLRHRHRFVDVVFPLRVHSAPCTLKPVIGVEVNPLSLYLYPEHLTISHTNWVTCRLPLRNFTYMSTRLNLNIDRFHPGQWREILLHLVFLDAPDDNFILEWGPVKLIRRNKRYHFD